MHDWYTLRNELTIPNSTITMNEIKGNGGICSNSCLAMLNEWSCLPPNYWNAQHKQHGINSKRKISRDIINVSEKREENKWNYVVKFIYMHFNSAHCTLSTTLLSLIIQTVAY